MKKLLSILLLLALLCAPVYATAPEQVLSTTHRIEQATIVEGDVCSATAIGPHALLTDTHCELGSDALAVDDQITHIKERIRDGRDHTIYIVDMQFNTWAKIAKDAPVKGDDIWICGNPAGLPMLVRRGVYSGSMNVSRNPFLRIIGNLYDFNGFFGDSGAAIFNAKGEVIDTNSQVLKISNGDFSFQINIGYGLAFTPSQLQEAAK